MLFMRNDVQPLHGLQDWSIEEWTRRLQQNEWNTRALCRHLLPHATASMESHQIAAALKQRFDDPMTLHDLEEILLFQNQCINDDHLRASPARTRYPHPSLLSYSVFNREWPLGIHERYMCDNRFAIDNSGLNYVAHEDHCLLACCVYGLLGTMLGATIIYIGILSGRDNLWSLEATQQNRTADNFSRVINMRTRERGTFASLLNALTFSALVNATLDKYGQIDPSTSTVLVGMVLGGTWGFVLDGLFGTDEGFREYLWEPIDGMRYALGSLGTWRYARYMITIIFDMFFTVILFQKLYPLLLRFAGFSTLGREWIANGIVSSFISVVTFQVYANMTRFQWAYPSGTEELFNQWISGNTMILATTIMNMVYLTSETRTRWGEPGINDPITKIGVTSLTFLVLSFLQFFDVLDPSNDGSEGGADTDAPRWMDVHMPLKNVCTTKARAAHGLAIFCGISAVCLGYVIFVTSRLPHRTRHGCPARLVLFGVYLIITLSILLFFGFVPLHTASLSKRNDTNWRDACDAANMDELRRLSLL